MAENSWSFLRPRPRPGLSGSSGYVPDTTAALNDYLIAWEEDEGYLLGTRDV